MKKLLAFICFVLISTAVHAQSYSPWRYIAQTTCSTSNGIAQDMCKQTSDNTVYICSSPSGCSGSGWVKVGAGGSGTVTNIATTAPLSGGPITTSGTLSIPAATTSVDGYLAHGDWNTFNGKQAALSTNAGTTHQFFTAFTAPNTFTLAQPGQADITGLTTGSSPVFTGLNLSGLTASQILATDGSSNVQALAVATYPSLTELSYVKGVTSAIQTQINGKQASGSYLTAVTADSPLSGSGTSGSHLVLSTAGTWSGNAATATALAANGTNCSAGNYPLGVDASGNSETCTALPTFPSGTVVGTSDTQTLTNKRITKRVVTASDATSVTPNSDNADITYQSNSQSIGTLTMNADTGTPTNGQSWVFKIKSTAVQTYSWNSGAGGYAAGSLGLPATSSGGGKIDYVAFTYDTVNSKWDYTGSALGY